ncbi:MAG: glycosyltransferase [Chloroflexota bacterium]
MVVNTYAVDDPRVIFSATSLAKLGYSVNLIGSARQRDGALVDSYQHQGGVNIQIVPHVYTLQVLFQTFWAWLRGKMQSQVKTSQAQTNLLSFVWFNLWVLRIGLTHPMAVIHCHDLSPLPACWFIAKVRRKKLIYDIHEDVPTMYTGRKQSLMTALEKWLVKRTDVVISAGHRLADAMLARGAQRVEHIGNWKPLEDYAIPQSQLVALRSEYHIPDGALVISFLGTLDADRMLTPLLDAVASLPDVYLMIAGRGEERQRVINYAEKHDNIIWLNWIDIDDLPAYTLVADVMYYCRTEQMQGGSYALAPAPNKLYEAFAAGIPLIARRGIGEIGEILEEIPAGILLDDVNAESIKEALQLLRDPAIYAEKRQASEHARDSYNWGRAEDLLSQTYQALLTE